MELSRLLLISLAVGAVGGYFSEPLLRSSLLGGKVATVARKAEKNKPRKIAQKAPKAESQPAPAPAKEPRPIAEQQPEAQPEQEQEPELTDAELAQDTPATTPETLEPISFENGIPATAWNSPRELEKQLTEHIRAQFKGKDTAAVKAFVSNPANRLLLAQWQFLHAENEVTDAEHNRLHANANRSLAKGRKELEILEAKFSSTSNADMPKGRLASRQKNLQVLEMEGNSPHTLKEALADPDTAEVFQQLINDTEWLEQMMYTGAFKAPGRAVGILGALAKQDKSVLQKKMSRAIATATAVEWAKSGWLFLDGLERAQFYIENDRENRLNTGFRKLPFWQLRIVCGCKSRTTDNRGSVDSLRWALENVHLPAEQYTGACWQANYLTFNLFNDTVHGLEYYGAYSDVYGDNFMQCTREVGGVCGSLSHFGTFAALANGVPALTAGEPGHCAYIVLINNKWVPAYSLSWERGLHWNVWENIYAFSSLHMATELYSPAQKDKTALSNACRTLGQVTGNPALLKNAIDAQPNNYPAWRDYANVVATNHADNADEWAKLNQNLCKQLSPRYPEMAAQLLRSDIYPHLQSLSEKQLTSMFSTFWKSVNGMGPDRWAVEALANAQLDLLKGKLDSGDAKQVEATAIALYNNIINITARKPAYAPVTLAWGNSVVAEMSDEAQESFLKSTMSALNKAGKSGKDGSRDRMLGQALLGAEEMRDLNAFQAIGKCLSPTYRKPKEKLPDWDPFPGKLVSRGGLLLTSSTCEHDDPAAHWGVLEPTGGRFHTDKDEDAWAVVQLPRPANITGVVTIAPNGNLNRLEGMKVQYSETGEDNDWHEAGAMPAPTEQRVNRLDLQGTRPRARYIRILRPGGPQLFHLNGIFVYGRPAA